MLRKSALRPLATTGLIAALATPLLAAPAAAQSNDEPDEPPYELGQPGEAILVDWDASTVAPGLELTTFNRLEADGWNAGAVLAVDLTTDGVSLDYLYSGSVSEPATVRTMAEADGATAAINGDFYDINNSFAPLGVGVDRDEGMVTSADTGHADALAVGTDGIAHLTEVFLEGTITSGSSELELARVNAHLVRADEIGLFTSQWGDYNLANTIGGATNVAEVTVTDGVITEIADVVDESSIAKDETVLVGRGRGAAALRELELGASIDVTYAPRADFGDVAMAVGGNARLVTDGARRDFGDTVTHPRSAVGLSEDGSTMYLVTIDGRQAHAHGMTLTELSDFMADIGADDALNLDGGGSSTLVSREPGTDDLVVDNSPSDGNERSVANGLGLFTAAGSGVLSGFLLEAGDGSDAATRLFPGLSRSITARGHDEVYGPAPAEPRWRLSGGNLATIEPGDEVARVTAVQPGEVDVTVQDGPVRDALALTVLDPLQRLEPNATLVALTGAGDTGELQLTGYDIGGYRAPIDPHDLQITGGDGVVDVDTTGDAVVVRAIADSGSAVLELTAAGVTTEVAVTVGLAERVVADFADAEDWTVAFARASGAIEPIDGPNGRRSVRMSYDFVTHAGATRAAYARPPAQFELPGQPQEITAWVEGDGNGTWIRMRVYDRNGTLVTLNGGFTTFTGWQQLTFPVPAGTEYPLTFRDIYAVQVGNASYDGTTGFSDIAVRVAPDVELPERESFPDPVLLTDGTVDRAPQRIAVMSDSQFVGRDPDSDIVAAARRTLREIVAAEPDLLVIDGDLVDEASADDFDLARRVLDEELADADFPWYYVPGNHEVQGGPIDNFIDEFGPTQHTFDLRNTRVITLSSAFGTLRAGPGGFEQIAELRRALDEAATDPDLTGVLVFAHHPPNDPLPAANSQLSDRREAAMVEDWLGEFEAVSGKQAAYIGAHAGVFHASSLDGVPYLINGNSGKGPAGAPDDGGFTGWTMLGIRPDDGDGQWLRAEVVARVDELTLSAPTELGVQESGPISATVTQDESRHVPVAWPMAADWDGGDGVHIGDAADAPRQAVVAVDPVAGMVTGLQPGEAAVSVIVNGVTASQQITVIE